MKPGQRSDGGLVAASRSTGQSASLSTSSARWRTALNLLSRNLKDLSPSFPELVCAGDALAPGTLVDG